MKKVFLLFVIFSFSITGFAQSGPITQAEYVKMLYALDKDFGGRASIVEALRKRGIDFAVTDGLRSLTRSKGRNDDELKRAFEEAGRRRSGGVAAKPLSPQEVAAIIEQTRKRTLEAVEEMPDFVVKQQIQRSAAYAGTGNFRNLDRLVVAVSYRSSGEEEYRVLSLNGTIQPNPEPKRSYEEAGGTSSTGEFVSVLATIFKPESDTRFQYVDSDVIRGRNAVMFDFDIDKDKAREQIVSTAATTVSTIAGMRGRLWIDSANFRVLRIDSEATEIPDTFPVRSAKRLIDYDWTTISGEKYLLPLLSDVRLTHRESKNIFETRNVIRFKDYQKYGTDVTIVEEDNAPINTEKP
ncbi:MAG: hypothetical protein ACJ72Z_13240 [Pyrinomonadaceae bacterium]